MAILLSIVVAVTLLIGSRYTFLDDRDTKEQYPESVSAGAKQTEAFVEPSNPDDSERLMKYLTMSEGGNIEIAVGYVNPTIDDMNTLVFEIVLVTHSEDLSEYKDIRKYVELQTDEGITIDKGFDWVIENNEVHHINGILSIKNSINGEPVVGSDTEGVKLVLKDIGGVDKREHIYEGENLR